MSDSSTGEPRDLEPQVADDAGERERESSQTDETRYERELDADEARRHAAAVRLKSDELPEPETGE